MKTTKEKYGKRRLGTTAIIFTPLDGKDPIVTITKNYHTQKCKLCRIEFHSRSPAKFCGYVCRNKASRERNNEPQRNTS